jgi:large subunit ribosomal protein L23
MSEKSYALSQKAQTYVFEVPKGENKMTVKAAVEAQFGVTVLDVNMLNVKGKEKRTVRKNGRSVKGTRSDVKKAYVVLKEGDSIAIFASVEDPEAAVDPTTPVKKTVKEKK